MSGIQADGMGPSLQDLIFICLSYKMPEMVPALFCRGGGGGQYSWETLEQASTPQGRAKSKKMIISVLCKIRGSYLGNLDQ